MTAYAPDAWDSFFLAQAGASAALAGLLFVGVSINVQQVAGSPRLVRRALEAFVLLVEVLTIAVVSLIPDASVRALGWGLLGASIVAWAAVTRGHVQVVRERHSPDLAAAPRGSLEIQVFVGQLSTLAFIVGSVSLIAESGGGFYWFAPATVTAFLAALLNAWVLLIEIQR